MGMFKAREPRKFRRVSIYTDERKEKLQRLVDEVKAQESAPEEKAPVTVEDVMRNDRFKGKFSKYTPRAQRHSESGRSRLAWPIALIAILILIMIWHYLLTGNVHL